MVFTGILTRVILHHENKADINICHISVALRHNGSKRKRKYSDYGTTENSSDGRSGDLAPEFAHLNDDILFGEVWSRNDLLSLRDRSLVTITSLISMGITDNSLKYHLATAKQNGITRTEIAEIITHIAFYAGWPKAWAAFNLAKEG